MTPLEFVRLFSFRTRMDVTVNREERFQTVLGFGGAFTDATGINIAKLEPEAQQAIME